MRTSRKVAKAPLTLRFSTCQGTAVLPHRVRVKVNGTLEVLAQHLMGALYLVRSGMQKP